MQRIIARHVFRSLLFFFLCVGMVDGAQVHAEGENSLSLSVTPPLFQLNATPGDVWKSVLKVINTNPYPLTVYAEVYDFVPKGEEGQGSFLTREGGFDPEGPLLANWLQMTEQPIIIPPEQSVDVPLAVIVPKNAQPGGHSAAILVGTRPPAAGGESLVRTSQVVTALFFMRVAGDVYEKGSIREFSLAEYFHDTPEAHFVLRFENTGTVHLQPQGDITIFNMWGKERGVIPINQKSHFGNVLPQSIRRFEFSWRGEPSLSDIGRYTAQVTLSFGEDGRQNVSQDVYFWVIPVKGALATFALLSAFLSFIVWAVRRYVRRALYLSGYGEGARVSASSSHEKKERRTLAQRNLTLPLREGVLDLRRHVATEHVGTSRARALGAYVRTYWLFFVALIVLVIFGGTGAWYLQEVLRGQKAYEITVLRGDTNVTLSSEEVIKEQITPERGNALGTTSQQFSLAIMNETKTVGAGAETAVKLEGLGYTVTSLAQTSDGGRETSVIIYDAPLKDVALTLSHQLGGVPVSATEAASTTEVLGIRLHIGKDMLH